MPEDTTATPEVEATEAEAVTAEETEATTQEPEAPVSRTLAITARKERAIRRKESEVNAKLEKVSAWEQASQSAKTDPVKYLEDSGIDLDYLANFLVEGEAPAEAEPDPISVMEQRIAKMETERAEKELAAVTQEQQKVLSAFSQEVEDFVTSNQETFPLVNRMTGGHEEVNALIVGYHEQFGKLLSIEEATKEIEAGYKELLTNLSGTSSEQEPSEDNQSEEDAPAMKKTTSLTNNMSASKSVPKKWTEEEADARVFAMLDARSR